MANRKAVPLLAVTLLAGLAGKAHAAEAPSSTGTEAPAITVLAVGEHDLVQQAAITGTLVPRDEVVVSPEIDGNLVTDLLVEEGDRVAAGQVMARLSHDMLDTQIARQAADVAKSEAAVIQTQN